MNKSVQPASMKTWASETVATVRPTAPDPSWREAISLHLWVLACGRSNRETLTGKGRHPVDVGLEHVDIDYEVGGGGR